MSAHRARLTGFSLLEVILALAILLGALAVLGEVARATLRNAQIARDQSRAQLLCESKLAEILAGISPAEAVQDALFEDEDDADWRYSVDLQPADFEGLVAVRVRVGVGVAVGVGVLVGVGVAVGVAV